MSGFSHHHDQSAASSAVNKHRFGSGLSPWPQNECLTREFPFQVQFNEVNDISSIDATTTTNHGAEVPSFAPPRRHHGLSPSNIIDDPPQAKMSLIQLPKRRKTINSKVGKESGEKKMKAKKQKSQEKEQAAATEYIHVRARRGQATDSHSLAERVRREKIGERMKFLQSLVPGCDKIAGKAQVLDEIINYVQSMQTQVQILVGTIAILGPTPNGYETNLSMVPPEASTENLSRLEASLSTMMMESSCDLLHFADDSHQNSTVSGLSASSSSSSFTSQGDQKNFVSQGIEVPLWEMDVQEQFGAIDHYLLDQMAHLQ